MENEEAKELVKSEDIIIYKCWICGKKAKGVSRGRCLSCQIEKCLYCGSDLIKLRRIIEGSNTPFHTRVNN